MNCKVKIIKDDDGTTKAIIVDNILGFEITCEYAKEQVYEILLSECVEHSIKSNYSLI